MRESCPNWVIPGVLTASQPNRCTSVMSSPTPGSSGRRPGTDRGGRSGPPGWTRDQDLVRNRRRSARSLFARSPMRRVRMSCSVDGLGAIHLISNRLVPIVFLLTTCAPVTAAPAQTERAQALLQTYKCYMCHADDSPKAGPAYRDVADLYRKDTRAVPKVTGVIRNGQHGGGPWHMPPHPEVSAADAEAMARYILSLHP